MKNAIKLALKLNSSLPEIEKAFKEVYNKDFLTAVQLIIHMEGDKWLGHYKNHLISMIDKELIDELYNKPGLNGKSLTILLTQPYSWSIPKRNNHG